ncbi:nitroreductase [Dactylosporangium vinaceum]|uniref:Acg family FMN-binding oxidoreductase n=1 Tax=Dactylosporangium vinaceum TaxID=53362 RepID=A0ABV5MSL5_9ACTN|nr:nitroreductase [Dactylosporangium vinaceum]UAC00148.1 nitroreductase [Dactylosporangium vinaceum]
MSNDALTHPTDAVAMRHALTEAATTAGYAPSIHNTQPWRWRLAGDALDLYTDRRRVLAVTDPETRLATLSCGVALHHARMSLAAQGWQVTTTRLPDPTDPDHLATIRLDGRARADQQTALHLRTIPLRHTDRRPVTGAPVRPEDLRAITAAVEAEDTWLHTLSADQVLELASAADHAQRTEAAEAAWRDELGYWTGGNRPGGAGIPDAAIPGQAPQTTVPGRDFGHHGTLAVSAEHDRAAVFALLYGRTDEPRDWLRGGEALSAGWLTATELGVSVLPHSAPIEVVSTRQAMRAVLASTGYPYLVLRLGAIDPADAGPPHAPRLPADQLIEQSHQVRHRA